MAWMSMPQPETNFLNIESETRGKQLRKEVEAALIILSSTARGRSGSFGKYPLTLVRELELQDTVFISEPSPNIPCSDDSEVEDSDARVVRAVCLSVRLFQRPGRDSQEQERSIVIID